MTPIPSRTPRSHRSTRQLAITALREVLADPDRTTLQKMRAIETLAQLGALGPSVRRTDPDPPEAVTPASPVTPSPEAQRLLASLETPATPEEPL